MGFNFSPQLQFPRALIVFEGLPIKLEVVAPWREWAIGKGALEFPVTFLDNPLDETAWKSTLEKHCGHWSKSAPERETPAIKFGQFVEMPPGATDKDDPSLLTMMFGSMGELLTSVDIVGRRFQKACSVNAARRTKYLEKIDGLLDGKSTGAELVNLDMPERVDRLPRLLLHGETGVGKTLIARYLHKRSGFGGRPLRISIPEYLGKEDMFEYDFFGYMRGAYTDAKEADHGLLLANAGGVVFLDEIGEANAMLQAKLLAYLDDYRVRPILIVAATNRDLRAMAKKKLFREDLLARFTDIQIIPPLRERMEDLNFILDCLLQSEAMNPEGRVTEIGSGAVAAIVARAKSRGFKGNFRELETVMRAGCQSAAKEGRDFISTKDVMLQRRGG
jgi:transcriptional regulator of acetoin/glycerol metabolism